MMWLNNKNGGENVKAFQILNKNGDDARGLFNDQCAVFISQEAAEKFVEYLQQDLELNESFTIREVKITCQSTRD